LVLGIIINRFEGVVNLFLRDSALAKLGSDNALGDLLMLVSRFSPCKSEFLIIYQSSLGESKDSCLRNLVFNATGFEVSEQLPLTLCTSN
jgi:hypothetical protein